MRLTALAAACCGLVFLFAAGALAQENSDLRPLLDRLDRLERDMNLLQRQVYRGGPGAAPTAATAPPDAQSAVGYEVRISQLEEEVRSVTGKIEEINYNLDQMKRRLDTLSSDVDQRLTALEHGGVAGQPPSAQAQPGPQAAGAAAAAVPPRGAGANPGEPASKSGVLGQLPAGSQSAAAGTAGAAENLPNGTPQEQYDAAFKLTREANYPEAEKAWRAFIQRYPKDPLAGNAQYWLGQTYYVRKDYANAAAVFAEGYQKYPKGSKAPNNLLELGLSLGQLGRKADACRAFTRLDRDFPAAQAAIKERAGEEKKRLGCG